jgi:hypothetical protein
MCEMLSKAAPDEVLFEDDLFRAFQVGQVPGFIMLATEEHGERRWVWRFRGARARAGHSAAGGGDPRRCRRQRVHVVYLGEHALHFHFGLFARQSGEAAPLTNGPLLEAMQSEADANAAAAARHTIRSALAAAGGQMSTVSGS